MSAACSSVWRDFTTVGKGARRLSSATTSNRGRTSSSAWAAAAWCWWCSSSLPTSSSSCWLHRRLLPGCGDVHGGPTLLEPHHLDQLRAVTIDTRTVQLHPPDGLCRSTLQGSK